MSHDPTNQPAVEEEIVLLEWTVHLLRREPARARVVAITMVVSAMLGALLFRSFLFALLGPLLLLSATAEYLFPIHYKLTTRRACASYGAARLEIAWDRVRRVERGVSAIRLCPFAVPNRLDAFRGVLLRANLDNREAVLAVVEEQVRQVCLSRLPAPAEGAAT